ncbi:MAG: hypothetical protein ACJ74O_04135 [Frankiaceae bacterium]
MTQTAARPVTITDDARRPGIVTFAAVMFYVLSAFYVIAALTEWSNSVWLYQRDYSVGGSKLVIWGFVDFALALVSAYGGYLLWTGRRAGQILGMIFAGISLVRWLFYIPADPWLAIAIAAMDVLILFGLASADEWFASRER